MSIYMKDLMRLSNEYGSDERYVVKGGGNTSVKDENVMYVKASGHALSTISEHGFVKMDLNTLASMWEKHYPKEESEREKVVLQDLMDARLQGETMRPSVEALLHSLIPIRFIVHLHPALVNGLTCSVIGEEGMKQLFDDALWIDIVNPGFILAKTVKEKMAEYQARYNKAPSIIFLQNHGVFVGSDSASSIDTIYEHIMKTLEHSLIRKPNFAAVKVNK
ncbi:MAG: class II aldolase/adducin family protein [Bacteroidales bacterium]|jgi:rhamnose utilization protein RhaD (predicted bifunctional aldolase and dehydrogenase)|nr:class II aldolase/adducin family protein [Bacteroidales bacterium]